MSYSAWSVVFGEQPSAAKWNILGSNDSSFNDGTGIANGAIKALTHITQSGCRAKRSGNLTVNASSETTILLDAEDFDSDSYHSTSSNTERFTAPNTGYYAFGLHYNFDAWDTSTTQYRLIVTLYKNGVSQYRLVDDSPTDNGGALAGTTSDFLSLTSGDYIHFTIYQATPNPRALTVNTFAWIYRVGT